MNPITLVALIIGGAFLLNKVSQGANASSLIFSISGAGVNSIGLTSNVALTITVQNPTPSSYQVNAFAGQVYINDNLSGNVSLFQKILIDPDSEKSFNVNVSLNVGVAISDIVQLINNPQKLNIRVVGTADAGIQIPFDIQYSLM
jgi:LEA14-like dessication related protein